MRERIEKVLDPNTFHEVGALSGIGEYDAKGNLTKLTPANCVFGRGKVDGRPVVVVGDDFTVRGGSADASITAKPQMAEEMARGVPHADHPHDRGLGRRRLGQDDRDQGRIEPARRRRRHRRLPIMTDDLAEVPVVALGLGSVAGAGAARARGDATIRS